MLIRFNRGNRVFHRVDSGIGANAVAAEVTRRIGFDGKIRLVTRGYSFLNPLCGITRIRSQGKGSAIVSVAPFGVSPKESGCGILHPLVNPFRSTLKFEAASYQSFLLVMRASFC